VNADKAIAIAIIGGRKTEKDWFGWKYS